MSSPGTEKNDADAAESTRLSTIVDSTDIVKRVGSSQQVLPIAGTDSNPTEKLCKVCNERASKYKCTRCLLPYCSVACSKQHKSTHPQDEPPRVLPSPPKSDDHATGKSASRPGIASAARANSIFAALDSSEQLQRLFKIYPQLPSQLNAIHNATLRPVEIVKGQGINGKPFNGRKTKAWNPDRGTDNGIQALNRARATCGIGGEAIREYSNLILQLVHTDEDGESNKIEALERELGEENVRIIEQLLKDQRD